MLVLCIFSVHSDTDDVSFRLVKPIYISVIGTFQDGGLKHNNPVNLVLWKCRQIWSSVVKSDLLVFLRTGTGRETTSSSAPSFQHLFKNGFIPQLYRSFMSSLDGQSVWRDFVNGLDERSREDYFRFNIFFPDKEPAMDNTDQMNILWESVHLQTQNAQDYIDTTSALLVSSFFFELTTCPKFESGLYHCQGSIHCWFESSTIIQSLMNLHPFSLEFVTDSQTLTFFFGQTDICFLCHRYCKKVKFYVRHSSDIITIYLWIDMQKRRKISGFSQIMGWFTRQQKFDAVFGTSDHGDLGDLSCQFCIVGGASKKLKTTRKRLGPRDRIGYSEPKRRRLLLGYGAWRSKLI